MLVRTKVLAFTWSHTLETRTDEVKQSRGDRSLLSFLVRVMNPFVDVRRKHRACRQVQVPVVLCKHPSDGKERVYQGEARLPLALAFIAPMDCRSV